MDQTCLSSKSHRCSFELRSGESTHWTLCHVPQTIPEPFLQAARCIILLKEAAANSECCCHGGYLVWQLVHVIVISTCMPEQKVSQEKIDQSIILPSSHSAWWYLFLRLVKHTHLTVFNYCSVVQFWCSHMHCSHADMGQHGLVAPSAAPHAACFLP